MKGIKEPPDQKMGNDGKNPPKRDKAAEARTEERERRLRAFQTWYRSIWSEMKRVTWPSREEWVSATLVTIALVLIVAVWTTAIGQLAVWIFKTGQ